jgi:hypothetical protein
LEIINSISQIKILVERFTNRLDQVEDRLLGFEDKVEEIKHSGKGKNI